MKRYKIIIYIIIMLCVTNRSVAEELKISSGAKKYDKSIEIVGNSTSIYITNGIDYPLRIVLDKPKVAQSTVEVTPEDFVLPNGNRQLLTIRIRNANNNQEIKKGATSVKFFLYREYLQLTDSSLQNLREKGVPDDIIERLQGFTMQQFRTKDELVRIVGGNIQNFREYQKTVLDDIGLYQAEPWGYANLLLNSNITTSSNVMTIIGFAAIGLIFFSCVLLSIIFFLRRREKNRESDIDSNRRLSHDTPKKKRKSKFTEQEALRYIERLAEAGLGRQYSEGYRLDFRSGINGNELQIKQIVEALQRRREFIRRTRIEGDPQRTFQSYEQESLKSKKLKEDYNELKKKYREKEEDNRKLVVIIKRVNRELQLDLEDPEEVRKYSRMRLDYANAVTLLKERVPNRYGTFDLPNAIREVLHSQENLQKEYYEFRAELRRTFSDVFEGNEDASEYQQIHARIKDAYDTALQNQKQAERNVETLKENLQPALDFLGVKADDTRLQSSGCYGFIQEKLQTATHLIDENEIQTPAFIKDVQWLLDTIQENVKIVRGKMDPQSSFRPVFQAILVGENNNSGIQKALSLLGKPNQRNDLKKLLQLQPEQHFTEIEQLQLRRTFFQKYMQAYFVGAENFAGILDNCVRLYLYTKVDSIVKIFQQDNIDIRQIESIYYHIASTLWKHFSIKLLPVMLFHDRFDTSKHISSTFSELRELKIQTVMQEIQSWPEEKNGTIYDLYKVGVYSDELGVDTKPHVVPYSRV